MTRMLTAAAIAALAAAPALAGPINKKLVGAEARWIFHLDVEAAAASTIGQLALNEHDAAEGLAELKTEFGVDLLQDVMGVTAWGSGGDGEDAVLIIHASNVVDQLLADHAEEAHLEHLEAEGYELLRWTDGDQSHYGHVRKTRRGDDRLVFIGKQRESLLGALRVADGEAEPAGEDGLISKSPGEGSFIFFAAPDLAGFLKEHAPMGDVPHLDKVRGLRLEAGEADGDVFAHLDVLTATDDDARNVTQAAQGLLALGRLISSGEKEAAEIGKLLDMVSVAGADRTVSVKVRCSADHLEGMLEAHRKSHHGEAEEAEDDGKDRGDDPAPAKRSGGRR